VAGKDRVICGLEKVAGEGEAKAACGTWSDEDERAGHCLIDWGQDWKV